MARRGVATSAFPCPSGANQVRCTPCRAPAPSVTAAIIAGLGMLRVWPSSRCQHFGWKRRALIMPPWVRPRERRYVSASVPVIGCEAANKRDAASGVPPVALSFLGDGISGATGCGRPRCTRASARRSGKRVIPVRSRMMSRRSPCSPVALSVLCGTPHNTEHVAARVMLRWWDLGRFCGCFRGAAQHNLSATGGCS